MQQYHYLLPKYAAVGFTDGDYHFIEDIREAQQQLEGEDLRKRLSKEEKLRKGNKGGPLEQLVLLDTNYRTKALWSAGKEDQDMTQFMRANNATKFKDIMENFNNIIKMKNEDSTESLKDDMTERLTNYRVFKIGDKGIPSNVEKIKSIKEKTFESLINKQNKELYNKFKDTEVVAKVGKKLTLKNALSNIASFKKDKYMVTNLESAIAAYQPNRNQDSTLTFVRGLDSLITDFRDRRGYRDIIKKPEKKPLSL